MATYADVQYCTYADLSGLLGPKLGQCNRWTVPYLTLFTPPIPSEISCENEGAKLFCGIVF